MHSRTRAVPFCAAICALFLASAAAAVDLNKLEKKLPEFKVKETVVNISPRATLYLPNGSFELALDQKFKKTDFSFNSRYDLVDNFMGFGIDILYNLKKISLGLDLHDRVDFNEIYASQPYLQRSQAVSPYIQKVFRKQNKLRFGFIFENTFTHSIDTQFQLDAGKNIVAEAGVFHNSFRENRPYPTGTRSSLRLLHSFMNLGSDYDYTLAEGAWNTYFYPVPKQYLLVQLDAGYPFDDNRRPLTTLYYAGGFQLLRGYSFKEFNGTARIHSALTYNFPLAGKEQEDEEGFSFSMVTWDIFLEAVKIGDRRIYSYLSDIKYSAGTGIGYKIDVLDRIPVQIHFAIAKAFENRPPQFYVTLSTMYYTWRN